VDGSHVWAAVSEHRRSHRDPELVANFFL